MANPNAELQAALTQFSTQPGISADQATQLRAAITSSPALLNKFNQDAHAGHLTGFAIQASGAAIPVFSLFFSALLSLSGCAAQPASASKSQMPLANTQTDNNRVAPTPKQIGDCKSYGSTAWKDHNAFGYAGIGAHDIEECIAREKYAFCSYHRGSKEGRDVLNLPGLFDANACFEQVPARTAKFVVNIPVDDIFLEPDFRQRAATFGKAVPGLGKTPDFLIPLEKFQWIRSFEGPDPNTTVYLAYFTTQLYSKKILDYYQMYPLLIMPEGPKFLSSGLRAFRVKNDGPPEDVTESILPPTPKLTPAQLRHVERYGNRNEDGSPNLYLDFSKLQYVPVMRWHTEFDPDHLLPESDPAMSGGVGPPHFGFIVWTGKRFELKQRIPVSQWPCGSVTNCAEYSEYPNPKKDKNLIQNK